MLVAYRVYCYSNIEELQELNARLTSELRDAEARRDEMVQAAQQQQ
jgi:FtsZ-binding cell division protein ZapB